MGIPDSMTLIPSNHSIIGSLTVTSINAQILIQALYKPHGQPREGNLTLNTMPLLSTLNQDSNRCQ